MRVMLSMAAAAVFFLLPDPAAAKLDHGVGATSQYDEPVQVRRRAMRHRKARPASRPAAKPAAGPSHLVTITCGSKPVRVARTMATRFSGFCRELAASGYSIKFVGGWRPGTCATDSRHPCGGAIDINQTARDVCAGGCPRGGSVNAMARRHGLLHGGEWKHADAGHFERLDRHSLARIAGEDGIAVVERPHPLLGAAVQALVLPFATVAEFAAEPVRWGAAEARTYLVRTATVGTTMRRQTPETSIGWLHPVLVERLAPAIREARAAGLRGVGCYSAYRMPAWGIGGYRNKFDSNHAYGLACDVAGIGRPGSATAKLWHRIALRHRLYNPYIGTRAARWEWNHYQVTPTVTAVRAIPALRRTITARGPEDVERMWRVADALVDKKMGSASARKRVRWAAAR